MGHESVGSHRPQIITDSLSRGLQPALELCWDSVVGLGGLQNLDCAAQFRLGTFNLPIIIRERVIIFISHKSDITASRYKSNALYIRSSIKRFGLRFGIPKTVNNSGTNGRITLKCALHRLYFKYSMLNIIFRSGKRVQTWIFTIILKILYLEDSEYFQRRVLCNIVM